MRQGVASSLRGETFRPLQRLTILEIYSDNNSIFVAFDRNTLTLARWNATIKRGGLVAQRRKCAEAKNTTARFSPDRCQTRILMDLITQIVATVGHRPQCRRDRNLTFNTDCDGWV